MSLSERLADLKAKHSNGGYYSPINPKVALALIAVAEATLTRAVADPGFRQLGQLRKALADLEAALQ